MTRQLLLPLAMPPAQAGQWIPAQTCTPAPPGSGPPNETCGTCQVLARLQYGRQMLKCGRMRRHWTSGRATDVRAKWPACDRWWPARLPVPEGDCYDDYMRATLPETAPAWWLQSRAGLLAAADWLEERGDKHAKTLRSIAGTVYADHIGMESAPRRNTTL